MFESHPHSVFSSAEFWYDVGSRAVFLFDVRADFGLIVAGVLGLVAFMMRVLKTLTRWDVRMHDSGRRSVAGVFTTMTILGRFICGRAACR